MNIGFSLAALLALFTATVHAVAGEREILRPLRNGATERVMTAIIEALWHMFTAHMMVVAALLVWMSVHPSLLLANVLLVHWLCYALIFLALSWWRFGRVLTLPQWPLFVGLELFTAAGAYPLPPLSRFVAGLALTGTFALLNISLLHVYWAVGGKWPGRDEASLAQTVVGTTPGDRMPGALATLVVAVALATGAALVAWAGGWLPSFGLPTRLLMTLTWVLAAVFMLRGLFGFFEVYLRPGIVGTPYARWNVRLYSPLCLGLAAVAALAVAH